jgi:predicted NAD-dependent protein-ADP-ribosyltransferase YbiA (DUF1768 family)
MGKENDTEIWKITKRYSANDLTNGPDSLGLPIEVDFVSIGTTQREYLVSFEYLKTKMAEIGCDLLTKEECKELDLVNSTSLFEDTYDMAARKGQKFNMSPTVRQYSFFNRWFIFKRRRGGSLPEGPDAIQEVPQVPQVQQAVDVPQASMLETPVISKLPAQKLSNAQLKAQKARMARLGTSASGDAASVAGSASSAAASAGVPGSTETHTIPVAGMEKRKYTLSELFQFYHDSPLNDKAKIGDPSAARWLSLSAPFPIVDDKVEYPSAEHYMGAMKYKLATNKPELAARIFSKEGEVHQSFLITRATETAQGSRALSAERDHELLKAERAKVLEESNPVGRDGMDKYKAKFDEGKWFSVKDRVLREALTQRWNKDERLRKILQAVKAKGLLLLYYTGPVAGSDLGGRRTEKGFIDGENKVGKILMELAGWMNI